VSRYTFVRFNCLRQEPEWVHKVAFLYSGADGDVVRFRIGPDARQEAFREASIKSPGEQVDVF